MGVVSVEYRGKTPSGEFRYGVVDDQGRALAFVSASRDTAIVAREAEASLSPEARAVASPADSRTARATRESATRAAAEYRRVGSPAGSSKAVVEGESRGISVAG